MKTVSGITKRILKQRHMRKVEGENAFSSFATFEVTRIDNLFRSAFWKDGVIIDTFYYRDYQEACQMHSTLQDIHCPDLIGYETFEWKKFVN